MKSRADIPLVWGDVRRSPVGDESIRILACDEFEAFFDFGYKKTGDEITGEDRVSYIRVPTVVVVRQPRLRIEPLTDRERALFHPELPMRLCRYRRLNWAQLEAESPAALADKLSGWGLDLATQPSLAIPAVTLLFYSEGSPMRSEKVESPAGGVIPALELLWRAGRLFPRGEFIADDGIGIYRVGIWGGLPAYMIMGYYTGAMWNHEEGRPYAEMPRWRMRRKTAPGNYQQRLKATKKQFPFKQWREAGAEGHDQYTRENCAAMAAIFDELVKRLITLGESATAARKLAAFKAAIKATNKLNEQSPDLIETGERDQLSELCNEIARAAGLDPTKYGGGEGPASEWRDW